MDLRKKILFYCITISAFLFASGVWILAASNTRVEEKPYVKYDPVKTEEKQEYTTMDNDRPINLLVLGLDEEGVRSDVIVLMNYSPKTGDLNILSVARDTKVQAKGKTSKINALIGMGKEKLITQKVEELTGLNVDYYVTLNFKGFRSVIDALGGIEFNIPSNMDYDDPEQNLHIHLEKGMQLLNGDKAEQFVRYRKGNMRGQGYTDGDIGRIKAQQDFMKALIQQKAKIKYLSKADDIFYILKKYMKTNIEISDINYIVRNLKNIRSGETRAFTLPGESAYINDLWYFICDEQKTRDLVNSKFYK